MYIYIYIYKYSLLYWGVSETVNHHYEPRDDTTSYSCIQIRSIPCWSIECNCTNRSTERQVRGRSSYGTILYTMATYFMGFELFELLRHMIAQLNSHNNIVV